jgi:Uncharacterised protein family (UPF0175)
LYNEVEKGDGLTMKVSIEFPDTAHLDDVDDRYLQEALVATLYHLGKLSEKEARQILGLTRRTFEEMLPRFGFSVLADDQAAIDAELKA